jgi:hypothetical protein
LNGAGGSGGPCFSSSGSRESLQRQFPEVETQPVIFAGACSENERFQKIHDLRCDVSLQWGEIPAGSR